jgi:pimeloyl-ACP methyl ester carboxylesterase
LLTREVGLDTHTTDVVNVIEFEDLRDVVLAGHSYGGMVISGVAERVPERLARLIYLDALVPRDGESAFDLQDPSIQRQVARRVAEEGEGWLFPVMRGPNDIGTKNTPHPWKSWTDPVRLANPAAAALPRVYVRYTADKRPGQFFQLALEESWRRAQAAGWPSYEVETMHQITPDPESKLRNLLELLRG